MKQQPPIFSKYNKWPSTSLEISIHFNQYDLRQLWRPNSLATKIKQGKASIFNCNAFLDLLCWNFRDSTCNYDGVLDYIIELLQDLHVGGVQYLE